MKLRHQVAAAAGMARAKVTGAVVPVAVRINVNNACHSRCRYCSFWHTPTEELPAATWAGILRELATLGTRRLSVSGGEPMLRDDLEEILAAGTAAGLSIGLNTTGHRLPERPSILRYVDLLKFSLDGPPEIHDRVRGYDGAFDELVAALDVARAHRADASVVVTMTRENVDHLDWILDFGRRRGLLVTFQPVMDHGHAHRTTRATFPDATRYQAALDHLTAVKRREPGLVRNSLGGLDAIRAWPDFGNIRCQAGKVFAMIEANGDVVPCDRIGYAGPIPNCREHGVAWALDRLPAVDCGGCGFVGSLELNRMMDWRPDAVRAALRVLHGGR